MVKKILLEKLNTKTSDVAVSAGSSFSYFETFTDIAEKLPVDGAEETVVNGVIAIIVGLVTTGIKDLFTKIFGRKKKEAEKKSKQ